MGVEPIVVLAERPIVLYTAIREMPLRRKNMTHNAVSPESMLSFRFIKGLGVEGLSGLERFVNLLMY